MEVNYVQSQFHSTRAPGDDSVWSTSYKTVRIAAEDWDQQT